MQKEILAFGLRKDYAHVKLVNAIREYTNASLSQANAFVYSLETNLQVLLSSDEDSCMNFDLDLKSNGVLWVTTEASHYDFDARSEYLSGYENVLRDFVTIGLTKGYLNTHNVKFLSSLNLTLDLAGCGVLSIEEDALKLLGSGDRIYKFSDLRSVRIASNENAIKMTFGDSRVAIISFSKDQFDSDFCNLLYELFFRIYCLSKTYTIK